MGHIDYDPYNLSAVKADVMWQLNLLFLINIIIVVSIISLTHIFSVVTYKDCAFYAIHISQFIDKISIVIL